MIPALFQGMANCMKNGIILQKKNNVVGDGNDAQLVPVLSLSLSQMTYLAKCQFVLK